VYLHHQPLSRYSQAGEGLETVVKALGSGISPLLLGDALRKGNNYTESDSFTCTSVSPLNTPYNFQQVITVGCDEWSTFCV